MTTEDAIKRLDEMQSQIIHGSRIFGDIADIIRNSEQVRRAALFQVGVALDDVASHEQNEALGKAHRILANNRPDGEFAGGIENRCSANDLRERPAAPDSCQPKTL